MLTESAEAEIPVAKKLLEKFNHNTQKIGVINQENVKLPYDPFSYQRRKSTEILTIGDHHVPIVFGNLSQTNDIKPSHLFGMGYQYSVPNDKWNISDSAIDVVYIGEQKINFELPGTLKVLVDFTSWENISKDKVGYYPLVSKKDLSNFGSDAIIFVKHLAEDSDLDYLLPFTNAVIILSTDFTNKTQLYRAFYSRLESTGLHNPVILSDEPATNDGETFQLWTASNLGSLFIDGFGDGIWLSGPFSTQHINSTSFGILQATRTRISKTEYISCPSCGRTLFDLQETTAKIREKTSHLKGLKIGIMGCIVNGPGEMADADYGYVGTGIGKIHLYKEKEVVRKNIPEDEAVDALIDLIRENGDWIEKQS